MRVRVFTSNGPLNGIHGKLRNRGGRFYSVDYTLSLEEEINRWLYENPAITISEIRQSVSPGWFGKRCCVVSIWYEPPKMELTRESAQKLVLAHVTGPANREDIVITEVIERPFGWVFCYNSKRYAETGDDKYRLTGNDPVLVDRFSCTLHATGHGSIEDCIGRYERTGRTTE